MQNAVLRQERVAAEVHARVGRVVAEQTQIFDGTVPDQGPTREGIAVSLGAQSPAGTWWFADGTTENGGTASLVAGQLRRPPTPRRRCTCVLDGDETLDPQSLTVPARSVVAVEPTTRVPIGTDYTITVTTQLLDGRTFADRRRGAVVVGAVVVDDRRGEHHWARRSRRAAGSSRSPTSTPTRSSPCSIPAPSP